MIRAALDRIVAIESGLSITDPVALSVKKAYKFIPSQSVALPSLPAFMNDFTFGVIDPRRMMSMRDMNYTVQMSFVAAKATTDDDRAADIAAAFWEKTVEAFCADVGLNGTVTRALLRGGEPTLGIIQRAGEAYIGFQAFLDIIIEHRFSW